MKMEFYEEFPTRDNLDKLKLIKFKTRLFIASNSVEKFRELEKKIKKVNKKVEVAYWPIIKNSYWISPFSNTNDLIECFNELEKIKNNLLIDLELPLRRKWKMYFKNIFYFRKNRELIKRFLEKNKSKITTAEYIRSPFDWKTKFLGLDYNVETEKSLMFYSSTINKKTAKIWKNKLSQIKNKKDYSISLGTIAKGILGNEPILSPENLEKDLEFVKKAGFKKVIIFRLGGLNKKHIKIIEKFI